MTSYRKTRGFTLVEILIVVIILGILAAIVIPQFTNASTQASENSTWSMLQTLRSQVELYKMQHNDSYPTANGLATGAWSWALLTGKTNADGSTSGTPVLGPYLPAPMINPLTQSNSVAAAAAAGVGWVLEADGRIYAVKKDGTKEATK